MIISRTPFRISFFGGGTDYPVRYRKNGGAVLSTRIDQYCYLTCRYLPPFFEHRNWIVWSRIEDVQEVAQIEHPAVRELLTIMNIEDGLEIHHDGDLPARSGLGSSSSFVVGLLHALYALKGEMRSKTQLALEAIHFEQERLRLLEDHLMLFYTGIARNASEIAGEQIKVTSQKRRELTEIYDMVAEGSNILVGNGDICDFGLIERKLAIKEKPDRHHNHVADRRYL